MLCIFWGEMYPSQSLTPVNAGMLDAEFNM